MYNTCTCNTFCKPLTHKISTTQSDHPNHIITSRSFRAFWTHSLEKDTRWTQSRSWKPIWRYSPSRALVLVQGSKVRLPPLCDAWSLCVCTCYVVLLVEWINVQYSLLWLLGIIMCIVIIQLLLQYMEAPLLNQCPLTYSVLLILVFSL